MTSILFSLSIFILLLHEIKILEAKIQTILEVSPAVDSILSKVPKVPEIAIYSFTEYGESNDIEKTILTNNPAVEISFSSLQRNHSHFSSNGWNISLQLQASCKISTEAGVYYILVSSCEQLILIFTEISTCYARNPAIIKYQQILILVESKSQQGYRKCFNYLGERLTAHQLSFLHLSSSIYLTFTANFLDACEIWEIFTLTTFKVKVIKVAKLSACWNIDKWLMDGENNRIVRRQDLEGMPIVTSVWNYPPSEDIRVSFDECGTPKIAYGQIAYLFWDLQFSLNFTERIVFNDEEFLDLFEKRKRNNVTFDIYLNLYAVDEEKDKVAQCLLPTSFISLGAYFIQPSQKIMSNNAELLWIMPGTFFVLRGVFIMTLMGTFVYFLLFYTNSKYQESTKEIVWWSFAVSCQKSLDSMCFLPIFMRIFIFSIFILSFFWYNTYTTTILSELKASSIPITSLQVLMDKSNIVYLGSDSDTSWVLFKAIEKTNKEVAKKVTFVPLQTAFKEIVNHRGSTCYITFPEYFINDARKAMSQFIPEHKVDHEICKTFYSFPYQPFYLRLSLFVPKHSPITSTFNYRILVGIERGLIRGRYHKIYMKKTSVLCNNEDSFRDDDENSILIIKIPDVFSEFVVLFFGMILSCLFLLIEKTYIFANILYKIRFKTFTF